MKEEITINNVVYVPKNSTTQIKAPAKKGLDYCIVRTYSAGVFAGYFDRKKKGKEGTVFNARRIWYWTGANSLSELAVNGTTKPNECKFPVAVDEINLKEIIEVIPCTKKAFDSIMAVKVWSN